jgi:pimeloyl-ACP methyl ester carboxylesterase
MNTLIVIGGLGDGLLAVPYTTPLSTRLPPTWCLVQPLLSSSYTGWGIASLDSDAAELALLVAYIRRLRPQGKIVLMGHSTGCQDAMHYLTADPRKREQDGQDKQEGAKGEERPGIDGVVLQAGVSDREGLPIATGAERAQEYLARAEELVGRGEGEEIIGEVSEILGAPVCARRWVSLMQRHGGDDYFSSDLEDAVFETTFGVVARKGVPILILYGGKDEWVPDFVDKEALVSRWVAVVRKAGGVVGEGSGVIDGASHKLSRLPDQSEESHLATLEDFFGRVVRFLTTI